MVGCPSAPQTWATLSGRHRIGFSSPCSTISQSWKTSSQPTLWLLGLAAGICGFFWIIQNILRWEPWGSLSPTREMQRDSGRSGKLIYSGKIDIFPLGYRVWLFKFAIFPSQDLLLFKQSLTHLDLVGRDHPAWLVWKETRVCQATNCLPGCTQIPFFGSRNEDRAF